jgi:hypothetical protein
MHVPAALGIVAKTPQARHERGVVAQSPAPAFKRRNAQKYFYKSVPFKNKKAIEK